MSILNELDGYIIVVNINNKIRFCNDKVLNKLMYTQENLKNIDILEIINEDKLDNIISIIDANGNMIKFTNKIVYDSFAGNDYKFLILEEVVNYTQNDLELILDHIPLLAWIKDLEGKYIYVNREYLNKFNIDQETIVGKYDRDLWVDSQSNMFEEEDRKVIREKGYLTLKQQVLVHGERIWFNIVKSVALDEDGKVKCIFGMASDINEEVNLEQEKNILEKEMAEEALKNEFFVNMSHEFKTPLNIVISAIQLLSDYIDNKRVSEINCNKLEYYVGAIKQNSYRLLRLLDNLIDITRIDMGYLDLNLESYNIVYIIENVVNSVSNYVNQRGIEIIFDTNEEEEIISIDLDKIERIILNLLSNAIKYTKEGGKIIVSINIGDNDINISIKDTGSGIPEEKLRNIFKKFVQVDRTLSREYEGTGIGLFLVKSLVEMHDGEISVKSDVGKGTEFIVKLPIKTIEEVNLNNNRTIICNKMGLNRSDVELSDIYSI